MREDTRRVLGVLGFWLLIALVVVILWELWVFHLLFLLFLLFLDQVDLFLTWLAEPTEGGVQAYWSAYWTYWFVGYLILFIMTAVVYMTWYRRKRPHLMVGGVRHGRVVWFKGIRRGLIYAVWDVRNYFKGAGSPFARGSRTAVSRPSTGTSPGTLQDPLTIPLGRPTTRRVIYFSRPWSLKVHSLILQTDTVIDEDFWAIHLPEGYIHNMADWLRPGRQVYVWSALLPGFTLYDPDKPEEALSEHLNSARELVQKGAGANPEAILTDYQDGSYGMVGGGKGA